MRLLPMRVWRWPLGRALLVLAGGALAVYLTLVVWAVLRPVRTDVPDIPAPRPGETVLVIAPHEDDETLGGGAYLREAVAHGVPVWVCLMTYGEGEELGTAWLSRRPRPSAAQFVRLGKVRQQETLRALRSIGVPDDHVVFLGYPNMGLRWMWSARYWSPERLWRSPFTKTDHSPLAGSLTPDAPFCGAAVLRDLRAVLSRVQPRHLFVTHPADTHPDHWATYCFTRLALDELRERSPAAWLRECEVLTYLVHRHGWPAPWGYYPELRLTPPRALADLPVTRWCAWPLTREQTRSKNRMILTYRSQAAAFDLLLRAFARRNELFAAIESPPTGFLPAWLPLGTGLEPRRDTEYLRLHPGTDIVGLSGEVAEGVTTIKVHTAAPATQAQLVVLLTAIAPDATALRAVSITATPGKAPEVWTSTDAAGAHGAADAVQVVSWGTTTSVTLPAAWVGTRGGFLCDAMTVVRGRIADHAMTRTMGAAPRGAMARVQVTRG